MIVTGTGVRVKRIVRRTLRLQPVGRRLFRSSVVPPGLGSFFVLFPALEALGYYRSPLRV
jgi:hypothetical protein